MKPLEFTKLHKEKLLEMCISLYQGDKRYNHIEILRNGNIKFFHNYSRKGCITYSLKITTSMHWFEFVITQLFMKVFPDTNGMSFGEPCMKSNSIRHYEIMTYWLAGYQKNYCKGVDLETYHPIDYLYKHFKTKRK